MSESINTRTNGQGFRRSLLTTVSAVALTASLYGAQSASASDDDSDRPVVWIELGGQLERMDSGQVPFAPSFFDTITKNGFESPLEVSKPSIYSNGAEAAISFIPEGSDWVFSGSVRYGRSDGHKALHQQTTQITHYTIISLHRTKSADPNFEDAKANNSTTHVIADFQAGKDVGLGMFGGESMSTVSVGVRFAQFSEKSNFTIHAKPDVRFVNVTFYGFKIPFEGTYHNYYGADQPAASFEGIGPSLSWKASTPLEGNPQGGEIAFDWGANAAVLFGRQKARIHYRSSMATRYHVGIHQYDVFPPSVHGTHDPSRLATVPNIGGFAGLSFRFAQAKISVGYRGDFFFGAMDGGFNAPKSENQSFFGPYASVSVGLP